MKWVWQDGNNYPVEGVNKVNQGSDQSCSLTKVIIKEFVDEVQHKAKLVLNMPRSVLLITYDTKGKFQ